VVKTPGATLFRQTARLNLGPCNEPEDAGSSLCNFLAGDGMVVNLESTARSPRRYGSLTLPSWLQLILRRG